MLSKNEEYKNEFFRLFSKRIGTFFTGMIWNWIENLIEKIEKENSLKKEIDNGISNRNSRKQNGFS